MTKTWWKSITKHVTITILETGHFGRDKYVSVARVYPSRKRLPDWTDPVTFVTHLSSVEHVSIDSPWCVHSSVPSYRSSVDNELPCHCVLLQPLCGVIDAYPCGVTEARPSTWVSRDPSVFTCRCRSTRSSGALATKIWGITQIHSDGGKPGTDWTVFLPHSIGCHVKCDARASKLWLAPQKFWRRPACGKTPKKTVAAQSSGSFWTLLIFDSSQRVLANCKRH